MESERKQTAVLLAAIAAAVSIIVAGAYLAHVDIRSSSGSGEAIAHAYAKETDSSLTSGAAAAVGSDSVDLSDLQLALVKVEPVGDHVFPIEKSAVGSIDFNQEMSVQVFTPYQGRIVGLFAKVGDEVKKGQTLFTIDSPDLLQAESTLIAAAGVLEFTTRNLARLRSLYATRAVSQKDVEQAVSEQQTAEGNVRAGRDAVRLFGKSDAEIDSIIAKRMADPILVVPSPISGRVTARNAAPGLYVQPGNAPAPFSVADVSTMWMLANVPEADSPAFRVGQPVKVNVLAFPDRDFDGKISTISSTVDPSTHRVWVRSEVADPQHELRAGMFATFVIRTGEPVRATAVPLDGVVREGDSTMTVWVTADRRRFTRRTVKVGMQRDGYRQILEGLQPGELIATEGALFLSNALANASR
ncbi:MAG: efflux RND transporter periplasmic adaptor subunit [Alphaproteobacteria bacterium]|nr:MAG: efflux RND transporter periplasmic adaptor subunit [Alphaproteobacteria bacterium]